jgi:hypothetical protein
MVFICTLVRRWFVVMSLICPLWITFVSGSSQPEHILTFFFLCGYTLSKLLRETNTDVTRIISCKSFYMVTKKISWNMWMYHRSILWTAWVRHKRVGFEPHILRMVIRNIYIYMMRCVWVFCRILFWKEQEIYKIVHKYSYTEL